MHPWLLAIVVATAVIVSCYFTAMLLVSAWRGEPAFDRKIRKWRRRR
jgi:hypothetical protein